MLKQTPVIKQKNWSDCKFIQHFYHTIISFKDRVSSNPGRALILCSAVKIALDIKDLTIWFNPRPLCLRVNLGCGSNCWNQEPQF